MKKHCGPPKVQYMYCTCIMLVFNLNLCGKNISPDTPAVLDWWCLCTDTEMVSNPLPSSRSSIYIILRLYVHVHVHTYILTLLWLHWGSKSVKSQTLSNLNCSKYIYILQVKMSRPFLTGKNSPLLLRVVKITVKTSQKCPRVHIWVNSQNSQLTGFDQCSYLPLKFS